MRPSMLISRAATRFALLSTLLLTLTSLTGCVSPKVISADQLEVKMKAGQAAPADGWFMSETRYQRYRRAVADAILKEETAK